MIKPPNLEGCIAAERAAWSVEMTVTNGRAELANTPLVEQALMALTFGGGGSAAVKLSYLPSLSAV
jgi:hypothetical protein